MDKRQITVVYEVDDSEASRELIEKSLQSLGNTSVNNDTMLPRVVSFSNDNEILRLDLVEEALNRHETDLAQSIIERANLVGIKSLDDIVPVDDCEGEAE